MQLLKSMKLGLEYNQYSCPISVLPSSYTYFPLLITALQDSSFKHNFPAVG